jgi:hypothetical protein
LLKAVPVINVYSEGAGRGSLDLKRNFEEKQAETERIENMKKLEKNDKDMFRNLLKEQKDLQAKLNSLKGESTGILNNLINDV